MKKSLDGAILERLREAAEERGDAPGEIAKIKVAPFTIHDIRRTVATGMAEIGVLPHIVEAALNHVSGAKAGVAGTYNRAKYLPEKKAALERWASHVAGLVNKSNDNVVQMKKRT